MEMLLTGNFEKLDTGGLAADNNQRKRVRAYLYGLFPTVEGFFIPPGKFMSVSSECRAMSAGPMGDEQLYLNGWIRDYVTKFYGQILTGFADMADSVQEGKTDGARLAKTLKGCDDPTLKTIVQNARVIHYKYPSSIDVVPRVAVMQAQSEVDSVAGQYSTNKGVITVTLSGTTLTLTDPQGRRYEIRPLGDRRYKAVATSPAAPPATFSFFPERNTIAFTQDAPFGEKRLFMGPRLDAPLDLQSPAGQYQLLAGQYAVISNVPRNVTLAVDLSTALTIAVSGSTLTLTDAQGRRYELQPAGSNAFVIAGTQATIGFLDGGILSYREGKWKLSAVRDRTQRR